MKNTYLSSDDRRVYEKNNDVITEVNKIEETNPSTVSGKENYREKDRLLEVLKVLFIKGCSRSINILANAIGVPVTQISALLNEITLATELGEWVDSERSAGEYRKLYLQIGNRYEISLYGDNCSLNQYGIDEEQFQKLHLAKKNKKLKNKKK